MPVRARKQRRLGEHWVDETGGWPRPADAPKPLPSDRLLAKPLQNLTKLILKFYYFDYSIHFIYPDMRIMRLF